MVAAWEGSGGKENLKQWLCQEINNTVELLKYTEEGWQNNWGKEKMYEMRKRHEKQKKNLGKVPTEESKYVQCWNRPGITFKATRMFLSADVKTRATKFITICVHKYYGIYSATVSNSDTCYHWASSALRSTNCSKNYSTNVWENRSYHRGADENSSLLGNSLVDWYTILKFQINLLNPSSG